MASLIRRDRLRPLAVGLVHRPTGTSIADRSWGRALVVRHARSQGLTLLEVHEMDDDPIRSADVVERLADLVAGAGVTVLVTDGVDPSVGARLARALRLRHSAVPPPGRRGRGW